jgi:hypothetical protein
MKWTLQEAIALCVLLESICPKHGCHVALTGGLLYRDGPRKDCDVVFYRIRQWGCIDTEDLWPALEKVGFKLKSGFGWCFKAEFQGKPVDVFFPEEDGEGTYGEPAGEIVEVEK